MTTSPTPANPTRHIDTVVFDLGGVIMANGSPRDLSGRFPDHDPDVVIKAAMGDPASDTDHPWHRLERGEISYDDYRLATKDLLEAAGITMADSPGSAPSDATDSESASSESASSESASSESASGEQAGSTRDFGFFLNDAMVELLHDLRAAGLMTALLTNNVREIRPTWWHLLPFEELFEVIIDSHEVGLRKPNPAIYHLTLTRLSERVTPVVIDPTRAAFLDDNPHNAAAATALGWHGIHVVGDGDEAIAHTRRLSGLTG